MPPSGFEKKEVDSISSFITSLLNRFQSEVNEGIHSSTESGYDSELQTIEKYLHYKDITAMQKAVLQLCKVTYLELQKGVSRRKIMKQINLLHKIEFT